MTNTLMMSASPNDAWMCETIGKIREEAKRLNINVESGNEENPDSILLSTEYRSLSILFRFLFTNEAQLIEAAKTVNENTYRNRVHSAVGEIRCGIEEGDLDDDSDVMNRVDSLSSCDNNADALFILTHSGNARQALDESDGSNITDDAYNALKADILDSLGDIDDLIEELAGASEDDKEEVFQSLIAAIEDFAKDGNAITEIVDEYTSSSRKRDALQDYLEKNTHRALREVGRYL